MWIIQSVHAGPVFLNDVGIMLTHGATRDLDLIGRENAERSNDVRIALGQRPPLIKTIKKDPAPSSTIDAGTIGKITSAAQKIQDAASTQSELISTLQAQLKDQIARNEALEKMIAAQSAQTQQVLDNTNQVLEQVKAFAEKHPMEIRSLKETLLNIRAEKKAVQEQLDNLPSQGLSDDELKTQERILKRKQERLEKNAQSIGKTISSSASDVESELDALDELGI
jgi:hypothetical protein